MDEDIIIDDGDPRNAVRLVRQPGFPRPGIFPVRPVQQPPVYQRPVYQPPAYQPPVYQPPAYQPPVYQQPVYQQPLVVQRSKRFLDMPTGEVLAIAAQAFAAFQPLPAAPTAIGKADEDVSNLIMYQSALAIHAKRDEQLRTIGALVAKLIA